MLIRAFAVNNTSKTEFIAQTEIDALGLMVMAESREEERGTGKGAGVDR
jgi:hypothetical protein